ncbi:unnamed protein product [Cylicostephanus goldi]|uniref:Uncharacterized protein n=1 Tax=Cylicostephanus goldi TaxID=71465 RepID=A0A3P7MGA7_CYLGO|nr:unnamed protein product [Cylicostephanus goldi]
MLNELNEVGKKIGLRIIGRRLSSWRRPFAKMRKWNWKALRLRKRIPTCTWTFDEDGERLVGTEEQDRRRTEEQTEEEGQPGPPSGL